MIRQRLPVMNCYTFDDIKIDDRAENFPTNSCIEFKMTDDHVMYFMT